MSGEPTAIIVMGVTGSGKTTVGRLLAQERNCSFFDADDFHPPANVAKMRNGQPLDDADRLPWLEELRALIGKEVQAGRCVVLACSALRQSYRNMISSFRGRVVFLYLKISPEVARARLEARSGHYMPPSLIPSQFEALEEPENAIVMDGELPPEEVVAAALPRLLAGCR